MRIDTLYDPTAFTVMLQNSVWLCVRCGTEDTALRLKAFLEPLKAPRTHESLEKTILAYQNKFGGEIFLDGDAVF